MKTKEQVIKRIDIVNMELTKEDEDVDLHGESEEYINGFRDALVWCKE